MSARWTEADLAAVTARRSSYLKHDPNAVAKLEAKLDRRPRNGAIATEGFASKREAQRWGELELLLRAGEIQHLRNNRDHRSDCTFLLVPAQYVDGKCVERSITYIADFVYCDKRGQLVVEDVKGYREAIYRLKRKLMLHVHKIQVRET